MSTVPSEQRQAFQPDTEPKADAQPKPQKQQDKHATAYVVLRQTGDRQPSWQPVKIVTAPSAKAAIQQVIDGATDKAGSYVAVPERSWQPVTVKVETQTVVKFD